MRPQFYRPTRADVHVVFVACLLAGVVASTAALRAAQLG
jgi:hypothetical protein